MTRPIYILMFVVTLTGCYSWQTIEPSRLASEPLPQRVRVTNVAGERFVLLEPMSAGDSLAGRRRDVVVVVPLTAVARVEGHRFSWWRTGFLIGTPVAIVALGAAACASGCGPGTMSW